MGDRIIITGGRGRGRRKKDTLIDQQRIASHIADCSLEVERINKEIHQLIPLIDFDSDIYKRVR
jgi:hypothetical protein